MPEQHHQPKKHIHQKYRWLPALLILFFLNNPTFASESHTTKALDVVLEAYSKAISQGDTKKAAALRSEMEGLESALQTRSKKLGSHPPVNNDEDEKSKTCIGQNGLNKAACSNNLATKSDELKGISGKLVDNAAKGKVKEVKKLLAQLSGKVADTVPADVGWGGTGDDFYLGIYAGVEGVSLDGLDNEGKFRAGVTAYNQLLRFKPRLSRRIKLGGLTTVGEVRKLGKTPSRRTCKYLMGQELEEYRKKQTPDWKPSTNPTRLDDQELFALPEPRCGVGIGLHTWLSVFTNSSAEKSVPGEMTTGMPAGTPSPEEDPTPKIEQAFEAELGFFAPVWQKHRDSMMGAMLIGPTIQASLSKIEDQGRFTKRYYVGPRFAFSPEAYFDLLYGKTEQVDGRRMEIKFQLPVSNLTENSRLLLGGVFNFGVKDSSEQVDSYRLFVTWNTNFLDIFGR